MLTAEQLARHMIQLLHAPIHVYDCSGVQTAVFVDNGEQQDVLDCDRDLVNLLLSKGSPERPLLYLEEQEILFGIAASETETWLLGPCTLGSDEVSSARLVVRKHGLDAEQPYKLSRTTLWTFSEFVLMLFEELTDRTVSRERLVRDSFGSDSFELINGRKVYEVMYSIRESSAVHNPYAQEIREQRAVRTGDVEALYRSWKEPYVGKVGTTSRDAVRNARNLLIVVVTLASRSAIEGGVLPEVAYSLSDAYIQRSEELKTSPELYTLTREAELEYCRLVRDLSEGKHSSPLVTHCKELIVQQLHTRISVKNLASRLEVTPEHLSRQFQKEEGCRLTDYIAREKIREAKLQLEYSDSSYDEIAQTLGFSSQSHFGQVFRKWTGMTPGQYRENSRNQLKK